MVDSLLTSDDCSKILQNYFSDPEIKYVSYKIVPLSENAEGFMGEHYRLEIIYQKHGKEDTVKLFLKTKPVKNKFQADIVERSPIYKKEIFLYDHLFKEFEKYGYDTSFAASSYYCIPNQTLVMDDLSTQNYELHPRHEKFTLEEIKCLLKSLAMYHAAGFAYERTKTKELGKEYRFDKEYPTEFEELLFSIYIKEENMKEDKFWKDNFIVLDKLIDLLPKEEDFKEEFKSLIKEAKICSTFAEEINLPKTCGHGDLWSNNMLFKYQNGVAEKCRLLDFQVTRYHCPCIDVILGIYSNTSAELRSKHLEELYQYYYETLSGILHNYGYSISEVMTLKEYHQSINIIKHEILAQVTVVTAIIYIPKNILTNYVKKDDDSLDKMFHNKEEICVEAFKNDKTYNQVISESMYDLYDALVAKLRT